MSSPRFRISRRRGFAVAAAVATVGALAVPAVTGTATASTTGLTTTLAGDVPTWTSAAKDLGALPAATPMQVAITIARPDAAGEAALTAAEYDPKSPLFHDFPTLAQWDARFGVPAATYDAVRTWATREGLHVVTTDGSRDYLMLGGTAAQVERTFSVSEEAYGIAGKVYYGNTAAPTVPAGLGVTTVSSLASDPALHLANSASTLTAVDRQEKAARVAYRATAHAKRHKKKHAKPAKHASKVKKTSSGYPAQDGCGIKPGQCIGVLQPEALDSVYDLPSTKRNAGQGEMMGIIGEGAVESTIKDLRLYEAEHRFPKMRVKVVSAGDDFKDTSGAGEWDLDTQSSTSMAPMAREEKMYFGKSLEDAALQGAISKWVNDKAGPKQASMSIGGCELVSVGVDSSFIAGTEPLLSKAVALGKTLFVSSGDSGGSCAFGPVAVNGVVNDGAPSPEYPASSPNAVAVGGSVLYTDGKLPTKRLDEYGWTYSGGGTSYVFPEPAWQKSLPATEMPQCETDDNGAPRPTVQCRAVPDIAALSGDVTDIALGQSAGNSYSTVGNGSFDSNGAGTSLSSPLSLGMWTRVQASSPRVKGAYRGLGFASPSYYKVALDPKTDARDFFDVGGSTDSMPSDNGQDPTEGRSSVDPTGYDEVTGLGVPEVSKLMLTLDHTTRLTHATPQLKADEHFAACPKPGGVVNDPKGDANSAPVGETPLPTSYPGLDITKAWVTYSKKKGAVTFHTKLPELSQATQPIVIRTLFGYNFFGYYGDASRDSSGQTSFALRTGDAIRPTTIPVKGLTGSFDNKHGLVTFVLPLKNFNAAVHLSKKLALGPGKLIDPLETRSRTGADGQSVVADEAPVANGCGYTLPGGRRHHGHRVRHGGAHRRR